MASTDVGLCSPPRIIVAGRPRGALGGDGGVFAEALGRIMPVQRIDAPASPAGMLRLLQSGADAVRVGGFEALHLLDLRLAPAALLLRARFGVPITASISAPDAPSRRPSMTLQLLRRIDQAFATQEGVASAVARRASGATVSIMRQVAGPPAAPSSRELARIAGMLRDITPGRLVIAVPWPDDREQVRWLRDAVVPLLHGKPVVLLLGAPSRRDARLLTGAVGLQGTYRVHTGALGTDVLAAAARCADIFIVPSGARRVADVDALLLTLTASGVPLVVGGGVRSDTLEHERNAFLANAEDAMSLVTLLNSLLALPAVQRHYLGEEFAAYTLERWSWEQAIGAYAARFASLVGRPQIPAELRAA